MAFSDHSKPAARQDRQAAIYARQFSPDAALIGIRSANYSSRYARVDRYPVIGCWRAGDPGSSLSTGRTFMIGGTRFEIPSIHNAESLVAAMHSSGFVSHDEVAGDVINGEDSSLSLRSRQRRFIAATGLTLSTARQIERARNAVILLTAGASISDTIGATGYLDQAHLSRSLRRYIGLTPASLQAGTHLPPSTR